MSMLNTIVYSNQITSSFKLCDDKKPVPECLYGVD